MDRPLIEQKLEALRRCVVRIRTRCPANATLLANDVDAQDILSLNLTRAVQLSVDIAAHWVAGHAELAAPATMGEAFARLAEGKLIDADLALRLRKAVGFRNLAVHNYEAINWDIVFAICQARLPDFEAFAQAVSHELADS